MGWAVACIVRELYEHRMGLTSNPAAIIAMDKVEDLVDFIVDHECPVDKVTGRRVPKSGWRFRIRWVGCGQEEDLQGGLGAGGT